MSSIAPLCNPYSTIASRRTCKMAKRSTTTIQWKGAKNAGLAQLLAANYATYLCPPRGKSKMAYCREWAVTLGLEELDPHGHRTSAAVNALLKAFNAAVEKSSQIDFGRRALRNGKVWTQKEELLRICPDYDILWPVLARGKNGGDPLSLPPRGEREEEDDSDDNATQRQANEPPSAALSTDTATLRGRRTRGGKRPRVSMGTEAQASVPTENESRPPQWSPLVIHLQGIGFQTQPFREVGPDASLVTDTKTAAPIRDQAIPLLPRQGRAKSVKRRRRLGKEVQCSESDSSSDEHAGRAAPHRSPSVVHIRTQPVAKLEGANEVSGIAGGSGDGGAVLSASTPPSLHGRGRRARGAPASLTAAGTDGPKGHIEPKAEKYPAPPPPASAPAPPPVSVPTSLPVSAPAPLPESEFGPVSPSESEPVSPPESETESPSTPSRRKWSSSSSRIVWERLAIKKLRAETELIRAGGMSSSHRAWQETENEKGRALEREKLQLEREKLDVRRFEVQAAFSKSMP